MIQSSQKGKETVSTVRIYEVSGSLILSGTHETLNLKGCSEPWLLALCYQWQKRKTTAQIFPALRMSYLSIYLAISLEDTMHDELVLGSLFALINGR